MPQKMKNTSVKRGQPKSLGSVPTDQPVVKKKKVFKDESFPRGGGVKTQEIKDQSSLQEVANPNAQLFKVKYSQIYEAYTYIMKLLKPFTFNTIIHF